MIRKSVTFGMLLTCLMTISFLSSVHCAKNTDVSIPELVPQTGVAGYIDCLTFSPDGRLLAIGNANKYGGGIKLWSVAEGRELRTLDVPSDRIDSIAFSPDGRLVTGASGAGIILWSVADGKQVRTLTSQHDTSTAVTRLDLGPYGRLLAFGTEDGTIKLWSVDEGRELRTLRGKAKGFSYVTFSPDGKLLAGASRDKTIKLWNVLDGRELRSLSVHSDYILSLAFSPDGKFLASADGDEIKLWNVPEGRELRTLRGKEKGFSYVTFSPDGKLLAGAGEDEIKLWSVAEGRELRTLRGHTEAIECLTFSPDGKSLASADANQIKLWSVTGGRELRRIRADPVDSGRCLTFSPDGRLLSSASGEEIKLWNMAEGRELRTLRGHTEAVECLTFSPDGKSLASAGEGEIKLWNVAEGRELRTLGGIANRISSLAFSPNGRLLAGGNWEGRIGVWSVTEGRMVATLGGLTGKGIDSVAFRPDGKLLASASGEEIKLWSVPEGRELRTLRGHTEAVECLTFSPDGKSLASAGEGEIKLWNVAEGRELRTLSGTIDIGSPLAFSPDGKFLASAGEGEIKLWNVAEGRKVRTLSGPAELFFAALSNDGRFLASADHNGRVQMWDTSSGTELIRLYSSNDEWLVTTPQGLFDGSDSGIQTLAAWRIGNEVYPPDRFFKSYYTPGLLAEIYHGRRPKPQVDIAALRLPPQVVIISPSTNILVQSGRVTVTADCTDQGGGVAEVGLYRNGKLVSTQKGKAGNKSSYAFEVDLVDKENVLGVQAFSKEQEVKSNRSEIRVVYNATESPKATLHLLLVGIEHYQDSNWDLKFARHDIESILRFFERRGQRVFASVKPIVLSDEKATKTGIQDALNRLAKVTRPDDVLLIYLVGHGKGVGEQFYFLTHEMKEEADEEAAYRNYGISAAAIGDALFQAQATKQVVILDTCDSEAALSTVAKAAFFKARARGPSEKKALKMMARGRGVWLIAASSQVQSAYELKELGHGILTYAILEGLGEKGPPMAEMDGLVTIKSLLPFVTARVPELTEKYMHKPQYPVTAETGTDFPLAVR